MKRSLSILLSLLLLFSLLPVSALAGTSDSSKQMEEVSGAPMQPPTGVLKLRCNGNTYTETTFPIGNYVVDLFVVHDNGSEYSLLEQHKDTLTTSGAVSMHPKNIETENGTVFVWELTITGNVGAQGFITYTAPNNSTSTVTITVAASQPPQGGGEQPSESGMPNGNDVSAAKLLRTNESDPNADTYTRYRNSAPLLLDSILVVQEGKASVPANDFFTADDTYYVLDTSNNENWTSVGSLHYIVDGQIHGIAWELPEVYWESISAPQDYLMMIRQGEIWYKLFVKVSPENEPQEPPQPTHGGKVAGDDRIDLSDPPLVTPFEWNGRIYYLSLAGWENNVANLVPVGGRGRTVSDGSDPWLLSARVFDCISGTPNQNGAVYQNNYTVYQEMKEAGWQFIIELHPTDVGCAYYPVQRHNDDEGWYEYDINEYSVGRWIFEAKIVRLDGDGNVTEPLATNCCRHFYRLEKDIPTEIPADNDADAINKRISEAVGTPVAAENTLFINNYVFFLPADEITGQLHIPAIGALDSVTLVGNGIGDGETILHGGISIDANSCYVKSIHFIGAGKDAVRGENNVPNCAIYGAGQGVYENCVFDGFYYALHGENRIAWGGRGSTFQNNHIAIYIEKALQGGNLDMVDNWFIGNDIAIQADMFGADLPVSQLTMSYDRFINNGVDMVNNSGVILWMSRNYFYRGEPVNGTWPAYKGSNSNYIAYMPYLPVMGGTTPTLAYPLARNTDCTEYFYPGFLGQHQRPGWWEHYCPNWWGMDRYPSFVREGDRMPEGELAGTRIGFFDGEQVVGSFDFGSSQEGE